MSSPLLHILEQVENSNHSTEYKRLIKDYSIRLASRNLPIIFDIYHLSYLIGIQPYRMINMIKDRHSLYNVYKIRKKAGGYRWIMSPIDDLKRVQYWIKLNILDNINICDSACAFIKGKSIRDNAQKHVGKELILNVDLYRFFDSITEKRIYGVFKSLGYTEKLSYDLAQLVTAQPPKAYWKEIKKENRFKKKHIKSTPAILPQGAPTSPSLSNIISIKMDEIFDKYANECKISYSRYADDLTFSGERGSIISLLAVKKIIRQQGFTINLKKTKYLRNSGKQSVTGITVNNGLFVDKSVINMIKQELYYCLKFGYKAHLKYKQAKGESIKSGYKEWLFGKICFIYSIDKNRGVNFFKIYNQINWDI
ncbi:RNA-directed DNA polymerase [Parabacteroides sp. 20_3]|jgi:RNA-directed DNA polymerase|uniref:reverse transcriptase family protein n=1 Tax=Parabacteroides sp. 20_3 TaxID=469591 RepID=UPI000EEED177|nr:reverse transcriptase family protein [Parabacteroides sp. 20_3]RGK77995.1 RNA-directed DNA polymerase [Parabacteroides sp. 20_3]